MEETIDYGELRPVPTPKKLRRANLACRFGLMLNKHASVTNKHTTLIFPYLSLNQI